MIKKVFVVSPLSSEMMEKLAYHSKEQVEQISLGFLKNLKAISALKFLRSVSQMEVVLENKESEKITDIFLFLFFFTKSRKIHFIKEDLSTFSLGKKAAVFSLIKNGGAIILGLYYAIKTLIFSKLIKIKKGPPSVKKKDSRELFYLKTNFWFGIKAGGSVAHVEGVISGFKNNGFNIDYAAIDCPASLTSFINKEISLPLPKFLSLIFSLNLYMADWINYATLKKEQLKDYAFIYHRMALNSLSGILLARKFGIPLVLEYNGSEVWVQRNWGKPLFLEKISQAVETANILSADYIVTVSEVLKEELIQRGVSQAKIICYPNCVNPEKFSPALFSDKACALQKRELGFSKDDIILTFIGTFGKWHGVEVLAKAIQKLFDTDREWLKESRVKFLLVGDGACMSEVREILSSISDYSNFITLTGLVPQEKAPAYLALSNILLSPHSSPNKNERFFGSPTKLFEYMAMEKVIIASDLDQIGEVLSPSIHINNIEEVNDSHLAILCEPGSVEDLKKAIKYAVNNLSKVNFMGYNSRHKVIEKYTWDIHVKEVLSKFLECEKNLSLRETTSLIKWNI